jgi:hypothetical protein
MTKNAKSPHTEVMQALLPAPQECAKLITIIQDVRAAQRGPVYSEGRQVRSTGVGVQVLGFVVLVLLQCSIYVVIKVASREAVARGEGKAFAFSPNASTTFAEFFKLVISLSLLFRHPEIQEAESALAGLWRVLSKHITTRLVITYMILGASYAKGNDLMFVLSTEADPGTIALVKSTPTFFSAMILWAVYKHPFNNLQWVTFGIITLGIIIVQVLVHSCMHARIHMHVCMHSKTVRLRSRTWCTTTVLLLLLPKPAGATSSSCWCSRSKQQQEQQQHSCGVTYAGPHFDRFAEQVDACKGVALLSAGVYWNLGMAVSITTFTSVINAEVRHVFICILYIKSLTHSYISTHSDHYGMGIMVTYRHLGTYIHKYIHT